MGLTIKSSGWFESSRLTVEPTGIQVLGGSFVRHRRVRFDEIDYVLFSKAGVLVVQYGNDCFQIKTRADRPKHLEVIAALLSGLRATLARGTLAAASR